MSAVEATKVDESKYPFELTIVLKKGSVRGGGLSNSCHVITSIDGIEIHKSDDAPSPPAWNQTIVKRLPEIQRIDPIILGFSVYKKRWTASGYKLVGSTQFPLSEILPNLNKDPLEKEIQLNTNRLNMTLSGTLSLSFQLKEVKVAAVKDPNANQVKEEPFSWSKFLEKWKYILTSSSRPVNAIIINAIHDVSSLFKYALKFDNPYFSNLMKLLLVITLAIYFIYVYFQRKQLVQQSLGIEQSLDSMISSLQRCTAGEAPVSM